MKKEIRVNGAKFVATMMAADDLQPMLDGDLDGSGYDVDGWYPVEKWHQLLAKITRGKHCPSFLERVGREYIRVWFHYRGGKQIVASSVDFLRMSINSAGYRSEVKGPAELLGEFKLTELDTETGRARIVSSTASPRDFERGVLLGALGLCGDLLHFAVDHAVNPDIFEITFVDESNHATVRSADGRLLTPLEWRMEHVVSQRRRDEVYWQCIHGMLNVAFDELRAAATIDHLTGIYNRGAFLRMARDAFEKALRYGDPMSLIFVDIDHFKHVNDRFGHPVGDEVLKAVAGRIKALGRERDICGRLGGEEFALFLPDASAEGSAALAERVIASVREMTTNCFEHAIKVTISAGVATWQRPWSLDEMIAEADRLLYAAKRLGRDRWIDQSRLGQAAEPEMA